MVCMHRFTIAIAAVTYVTYEEQCFSNARVCTGYLEIQLKCRF